jgi:hypothetical protein
MKMDVNVQAALIAAGVALIGTTVTWWQTRVQLRGKIDELTQAQYKDILDKRIEVYPELWLIAQTRLSDLERIAHLTDPRWVPDPNWAHELLADLIEWHQNYGVFLSQASYAAFAELRNRTVKLVRTCNLEKRGPTLAEFQELDRIYYAGYDGKLPLATQLKNDLGSYKTTSVSW